MSERLKILELLEAGKITATQAEQLLEALDAKRHHNGPFMRARDRINFDEFKNLGAQVSSVVTQSLQEAKKAIEQQVEHWKASMATMSVSKELSLPPEVQDVSIETVNGKIQVVKWSQPHVDIVIRAQVRESQLKEARERLDEAVVTQTADNRFHLEIQRTGVVEANVDVFVPDTLDNLMLVSQNGGIHADAVKVKQLGIRTENGGVRIYRSQVENLKAVTANGGIEVHQSVSRASKNVYLETRNGKISVFGIAPGTRLSGEARTQLGKIDIAVSDLKVAYDDEVTRNAVRFESTLAGEEAAETRLNCETSTGSVRIEAV
jgi:DUF4097 and DUF4098 domain-containing protein YvlB